MSSRLFRITECGWSIYREPQSCALYAEFSEGTKMRLSYLAEPEMVYFAVSDRRWKLDNLLSTVMVQVEFEMPSDRRLYRCAGLKLANPDGTHGYSVDNFAMSFIDHFAEAANLEFGLAVGEGGFDPLVGLDLSGSEQAIRTLRACNSNFYARAIGGPEDEVS